MSGGGTPSKTTQTIEPPSYLRPHLESGARAAQNLYGQGGPQYYPGETVVPFSSQTEQALELTEQRALGGSPVNQAAQNYATNTLNSPLSSQFGDASNPWASGEAMFGGATNPYLDATFNKAADSVQNRLATTFAGSGRNIDASRAPMAEELNNLATGLYGGAYESERNRQFGEQQQRVGIGAQGYESERDRMAQDLQSQAGRQFGVAGLAPALANQDYVDLDALYGVGGQYEDLAARQMEDQASRWDFQQNAPQVNLDNYLQRLGMLTGGAGNTSTAMTPTYRNRGAGALGGAASGASVGSAFGPWGTGIGAVAGGLLGAFA